MPDMTTIQLALYLALFGSPPCGVDYHHCPGPVTPWTHHIEHPEGNDPEERTAAAVSEPAPEPACGRRP